MKEYLGPAYELMEEYNKLSEEDKRKFKILFERSLELKWKEFEEMQKFTREDGSVYFNTEYLLKHVLGLSDDEIKKL